MEGFDGTAKAVVRRYFQRLLNERDLTACDEMLTSDYVDHDAPAGTPPGPENTKQFIRRFLEDFPDLHIEIEDLIAEENKVAGRLIWHGHRRETREPFHLVGIVFLRLNAEGQLAERWSAYKS